MQSAMTVLTIVGGLMFSISCALLVEELIFGGLFKIFFQSPQQTKSWFAGDPGRNPQALPVKVESFTKRNKQL